MGSQWQSDGNTGTAKYHADIVIGLAVIKFGYSGKHRGWWLPGGIHTTSYLEAESAARLINRAMKGAVE